MSKKIMMLALAAVSAAVFALPATASAEDIPLHLNPTPSGAQAIDGVGEPVLTAGSFKVSCPSFSGSATFEAGGTTGTMSLKFGPTCKGPLGVTCTSKNPAPEEAGVIRTTSLPFHLLTLTHEKPGVLVTPGSEGDFAIFFCAGIETKVTGNGLLGTITEPLCGETKNMATINFATVNGLQEHTTVEGTPGVVYGLKKGTENATESAKGTLTLNTNSKLECT